MAYKGFGRHADRIINIDFIHLSGLLCSLDDCNVLDRSAITKPFSFTIDNARSEYITSYSTLFSSVNHSDICSGSLIPRIISIFHILSRARNILYLRKEAMR